MTVIGYIITILGVGSISFNLLQLIDKIDHPQPSRRRRA